MISIDMLPGGHGDALVVEYGSDDDRHYLLVDAGTIHRYEDVRRRLLDRDERQYEAFVVTHVDEDHIGGAVELLSDADLSYRISSVWFNGYVHSDRGGNVLGPVDGEPPDTPHSGRWLRMEQGVSDPVSPVVGGPVVVPSKGDLPTFELPGGALVYLLSPSGPKLKRMAKTWMEAVTAAHLDPAREPTARTGRCRPLKSTWRNVSGCCPIERSRRSRGREDGMAVRPTAPASRSSLNIRASAPFWGGRAPSTLVASLKRFGKMKAKSASALTCSSSHITGAGGT